MPGSNPADYSNIDPGALPDYLNPAGDQDGFHPLRWNGIFDHLGTIDTDDPFRLRVQKYLTIAFKQVIPANGFYCDLSDVGGRSRVQRGRTIFGEGDPLPLVSILERPFAYEAETAPLTGETRNEPYDLIIQGFTEDDDVNHPTDPAHYLLADIKRRLSGLKVDEGRQAGRVLRFGTKFNSVVRLQWDAGVVRPSDEVSNVAHFWLRLQMEVSEDSSYPAR